MSNLIEKLKEVDLGNGCLSVEDGKYLERYVVPDIPKAEDCSAVKIVFLVESPHTEEVRDRYPLAGSSGCNVTKDLIFDHDLGEGLADEYRNAPIGSLAKAKISWLSIMNVSLLPLQKSAYNNTEEKSNQMRTLWCALKEIKGEMEQSKDRDPDLCPISSNVYDIILKDLACRIEQIIGYTKCRPNFVPFGNIARRSLCRVNGIRQKQNLPELSFFNCRRVPHPSVWSRLQNSKRKECLNAALQAAAAYIKTNNS